MFEQLDDKVGKSGLRWTIWLGGLIVALLVGSMFLVQTLWPETVSRLTILAKESLVAPPTPPHAAEPAAPEPPKTKNAKATLAPPTQVFLAGHRRFRPKSIRIPSLHAEARLPVVAACISCVVGGIPGVPPGGFGGTDVAVAPPLSAPAAASQRAGQTARSQANPSWGQCANGYNLVNRVLPIYPPLAKTAHIQGVVRFTAVISKDGSIQQLRLIDGPPLLIAAAQSAVSRWSYRPTLLNGQAVEVVTTIEVRFTLNQ